MAAALEANLAFLLEEKEVPAAIQEKIAEARMLSLNRFILMAANHDEWRTIMKDEWGMDPSASTANRFALVTILDAWDESKARVAEERRADAEARQAGLPKPLGKQPHQLARTAVETRFHKLSDKEAPSQATVDKVLAMLEERHAEDMNFKEVLSVDDAGDEPEPTLGMDKTGAVRVRRKIATVAEPRDSEELRRRIFTWVMAYAFAFVRMPQRKWLESATPTTSATYSSYLLGDRVHNLSATTANGTAVASPTWAQVLHYDRHVRKHQADLINQGQPFQEALDNACKSSELRELYLTTPTSITAALQAVQNAGPRERSPRRPIQEQYTGGGQSSWFGQQYKGAKGGKGGGKHKGGKSKAPMYWPYSTPPKGGKKGAGKFSSKGSYKGSSKGFKRGLLSETADRREICFDFNQPHGCPGGCKRVHICRVCGREGHGMHQGMCPAPPPSA